MASEDPAEAIVYLSAWWCTVGLCIFADDLCLGVAWVDCLALPVAEGPTPVPYGCVCKLATLPNIVMFIYFHGENDSPADLFFFPHLQRNPAGFQLETSCHKRRFCATASAPTPWRFPKKSTGFAQKTWYIYHYLPYAPPIHGTFYGENMWKQWSNIGWNEVVPTLKSHGLQTKSQSLWPPKVQASSDPLLGICWDGDAEVRSDRGARMCFGSWWMGSRGQHLTTNKK